MRRSILVHVKSDLIIGVAFGARGLISGEPLYCTQWMTAV